MFRYFYKRKMETIINIAAIGDHWGPCSLTEVANNGRIRSDLMSLTKFFRIFLRYGNVSVIGKMSQF